MNYLEKEWIEAAKNVGRLEKSIAHLKKKQMIYRINKKAYEVALRERKFLLKEAMRGGNHSAVSVHHKVINILREQLYREDTAILSTSAGIKAIFKNLDIVKKRRDQFERAYYLVLATDQLAMANAQIMADVPVVPMGDGDMEQIVKDLGY